MSKLSPDDWRNGIDPAIIRLVSVNWGYFAKMVEAIAALETAKELKRAYDRGYRAAQRKALTNTDDKEKAA